MDIARESSLLFFISFIISPWGNLYLCGLGLLWWYLSIQCFFFQLAGCCFSCTMIHQLFSHLLQGYYQLWIVFIMLLMVFSPFGLVWTRCLSLNFRLRLLLWWKKNQTFLCFHRGLCLTKNLKRATGQLSPFSDNGRHMWLEIIVVMMENLYLCSFNAEQV